MLKCGISIAIFLITHLIIAQTNCNDAWYTGEGTQYGGVAGGAGGHCGIPVISGDIYHAAMNHEQYAESQACGACVRILGPKGEAIVKIVDECPECKFGDIDVTTGVFPQLADIKDGRIDIRWRYVPCELLNNIKIVFATGSGPYYFKAQLRNFYYPITTLEYQKTNGDFDTIPREVYNYFVAPNGIDEDKTKTGPYTFRITSITGQTILLENILFSTTEIINTGKQFEDLACPDCAGVAGGNAQIDNCNVCAGGTTGILLNSSCEKDCANYWEGTAYIDDCDRCVAGTTGLTPCDNDCNNDPGGLAYRDNCEICVGGNTGKTACKKDCNNEWGGLANIDSCGICSGGSTEVIPVLDQNECFVTGGIDKETQTITLYPNPTNDNVFLSKEINWVLYSLQGSKKLEGKGKMIFMENLPEGIYLLKIDDSVFKVLKIN